VPLRHHLDIKKARITRRRGNGVIQVEFFLCAFTRKFSQTPERNLDVSRTEFDLVVVIAVHALFPNLYRCSITCGGATDTNTFRIKATISKRRRAVGADPLVTALMAILLFIKQLF